MSAATDSQYRTIESLSSRLGYSHSSQAIKDIVGKNPVQGLSQAAASQVISGLLARTTATPVRRTVLDAAWDVG